MNTEDEKKDNSSEPNTDPFPEPRTVPSGWDVKGFLLEPRSTESEKRQTRRYATKALHMKTGVPIDTSACQYPN